MHTGEFERGAAIVRRAMELNANHAGWMHFAPLWEHFHKGEYEQALERANRVDVPGLFWPYLVVASACGHLGRRAEAEAAVRDLLALDPEFAAHARSNVGTWHFASGLMEPILDGLRKAGLAIPETDDSSDAPRRKGPITAGADRAVSATDSGAARADEGFWVAVLPFKYGGTDASLTALAEGLTEEIVTGLSRFSYLRVISHSATIGCRLRRQAARRAVCDGGEPSPGGDQAPPRRAAASMRAPAPISGPRTTSALSARRRSSRCRTTSFPGSSRRLPTCTVSCRAA